MSHLVLSNGFNSLKNVQKKGMTAKELRLFEQSFGLRKKAALQVETVITPLFFILDLASGDLPPCQFWAF